MAMRLVVVTTVATDPTRESGPFRETANVSESSSLRARGEARGVADMDPLTSQDHRVHITWRRR